MSDTKPTTDAAANPTAPETLIAPTPPPARRLNPIPGNKPFVRGDPRANTKGRPKDSDRLKALCQRIGAEKQTGSLHTILEAALRKCAMSDDPRLLALFLCYGWGRPVGMDSNAPGAGAQIMVVVGVDGTKI
jgi:hypothetical protein